MVGQMVNSSDIVTGEPRVWLPQCTFTAALSAQGGFLRYTILMRSSLAPSGGVQDYWDERRTGRPMTIQAGQASQEAPRGPELLLHQ
jgi:hypothetical protein